MSAVARNRQVRKGKCDATAVSESMCFPDGGYCANTRSTGGRIRMLRLSTSGRGAAAALGDDSADRFAATAGA